MSLSFPTMAAIRFGYGLRPGEKPPQSKDELIGQVARGATVAPRFPVGGIEARHADILDLQDRLKQIRKADGDDATRRQQRRTVQQRAQMLFQMDANARLLQPVLSPDGFNERLATFWTNHFSTSADKSLPMRLLVPLYEAEAIRPHMGGTFAALLRSATEHPSMLIYLDQAASIGPESRGGMRRNKGLNENLGRELLELHTLGAGSGYTQADVRSAAMVLTGLTVDYGAMQTDFRPQIAEPGEHDVLGVNYGGNKRTRKDYLAMLDDLAANPKTSEHICRKLAAHFIADQPPQEMISAMGEAWKKTDGNLTEVYRAMLDHPAAWANEGAKARQPFDYIVAGLRALDSGSGAGDVAAFMEAYQQDDADGDTMTAKPQKTDAPGMAPDAEGMKAPPAPEDEARLKRRKAFQMARALGQGALRRMGQPTWLPPSPAGFEDNFSVWITASQLSERLAWARRAGGQFGGDLDPREFLKSTLADAARDETIRVVSQAPNRKSGLTLVLASPEFNRR